MIMTVEEVADYLRLHKITIYRMLKEKKLVGIKIGHSWRFKKEEVDKMFKMLIVMTLLVTPCWAMTEMEYETGECIKSSYEHRNESYYLCRIANALERLAEKK